MLTWELLGAVVGAGLASGREIAAFFTQYGTCGTIGILISALTLACLTGTEMPSSWQGRWPAKVWSLLLAALLVATGGAMLSGSGVVAALFLPLRDAEMIGMVLTFLLAWLLAYHTKAGLAWVSRLLLFLLTSLLLLGFALPVQDAAALPSANPCMAFAKCLTYAGFNAALQTSLLAAKAASPDVKRRSIRWAACLLGVLLLLGHGVLLRHSALLAESMPFIRLTAPLGRPGYVLGACCMYLAILSTLTAVLRGLKRRLLPIFCVAWISLFGFAGVVETVYPLLGGGCLLYLAAAKFTNSARRPFISPSDML